ncbi:MAG: hypothetical protein J5936_03820 [Acholeplasmatales bacterium]|nr:hypothetical protein [Acholeplasmatales bacterium]
MASYKKKKIEEENVNNEAEENLENEPEFDRHSMETVVNRVRGGLVGEYKILDSTINKPMFKQGDIVCFRAPARLQKSDFVLYAVNKDADEFAIRRIIKFVDDDIYVAGDHESEYHIIHREDVVAKAISRERKNKWLTLTGFARKKRFYVFKKVKLAKLRLGNRVRTNEDDINSDALELAMQNVNAQQQQVQEKPKYVITIDLDSDLAAFLNPDDLAKEWLEAEAQQAAEEAENVREIYVDEDGNPISKEEYEALMESQEEELEESESEESEDEESEDESEEAKEEPQEDLQIGIEDDDL